MNRCFWLLSAALFAVPALNASFIITPNFDSSLTSDPNAAAIENVINTAITFYEATFTNNMDIVIDFDLMTGGLGQSSFFLSALPYSTYRADLVANQSGANDALALMNLRNTSANPVTGTNYVNIKPATEAALGVIASSPTNMLNAGTIGLNASLTTTGANNSSGNFMTGSYSLLAVTEHEIDEILGLGSTLGLGLSSTATNSFTLNASSGNPSPEDLFRYNASGARSFTLSDTPNIYFSLNGTTDLAQFDNQADGGDYGDWQSNPLPTDVMAEVQDAFASPGSTPILTTTSPEVVALDAIGYTIATPEPSTAWLLTGALALFGYRRRRSL